MRPAVSSERSECGSLWKTVGALCATDHKWVQQQQVIQGLVQMEKQCTRLTARRCMVSCIGFDVYNMAVTGEVSKTLNSIATDSDHVPVVFWSAGFSPTMGAKAYGIGYEEEKMETLRTGAVGEIVAKVTYGVVSKENVITFCLDQQGGKGGANYQVEKACTLLSDSHGTPHAVAIIRSKKDELSRKTGPLMANSHPGSYSGQDVYNNMLITDRGGYNVWMIGNGQLHQIHLQSKAGALNAMHDQQIVLMASTSCGG